ncbi:unnamed protein product, partial [Prorocentrum cordatum]
APLETGGSQCCEKGAPPMRMLTALRAPAPRLASGAHALCKIDESTELRREMVQNNADGARLGELARSRRSVMSSGWRADSRRHGKFHIALPRLDGAPLRAAARLADQRGAAPTHGAEAPQFRFPVDGLRSIGARRSRAPSGGARLGPLLSHGVANHGWTMETVWAADFPSEVAGQAGDSICGAALVSATDVVATFRIKCEPSSVRPPTHELARRVVAEWQ